MKGHASDAAIALLAATFADKLDSWLISSMLPPELK
jgi:hypothetical protein